MAKNLNTITSSSSRVWNVFLNLFGTLGANTEYDKREKAVGLSHWDRHSRVMVHFLRGMSTEIPCHTRLTSRNRQKLFHAVHRWQRLRRSADRRSSFLIRISCPSAVLRHCLLFARVRWGKLPGKRKKNHADYQRGQHGFSNGATRKSG